MIGEAAALSASLCWAVGSHLFGRIGRAGDVPPGAMNLGKCGAGALLFALTGAVLTGRVLPAVGGAPLGFLVASGVVGLALGDASYFGAMLTIGVRRALLLLSTAPVFAAVGGALFLDESLRARDWAAILAAVAGVALVVYEPEPAARARADKRRLTIGLLLGLGAGLGQAAGSLMSRHAMNQGVAPLDAALVRLPAGLAGIVLLATLSGRLVPWVRILARPRLLPAIAASAFVGTYCGIWLAQIAIGRSSSTAIASTLLGTSPIFALPLGWWLNGERITAQAVGGTLLATGGLVSLAL